jgi:hypothetical protein
MAAPRKLLLSSLLFLVDNLFRLKQCLLNYFDGVEYVRWMLNFGIVGMYS